jgi:transcriptional regulator with XRE-family HTH domain
LLAVPITQSSLKALGERIRVMRKAKDLTQENLAHESDIDRSYIGGVEYPSKQAITETLHNLVGNLDCTFKINGTWRAVIEWETGNISSSHRSMNKLCLALMSSQIDVGVLIVPSRSLYPHLTDRIGNWMELSPYLHFWKKVGAFVKKGLLAVTVVEHDELTDNPSIPYIGQGKDGRSAEGKSKLK